MRIDFDGRLYTLKAVEAAAADYAEFGKFRIEETGGKIAVELEPLSSDFDDDALEAEFSNYVLGKMEL